MPKYRRRSETSVLRKDRPRLSTTAWTDWRVGGNILRLVTSTTRTSSHIDHKNIRQPCPNFAIQSGSKPLFPPCLNPSHQKSGKKVLLSFEGKYSVLNLFHLASITVPQVFFQIRRKFKEPKSSSRTKFLHMDFSSPSARWNALTSRNRLADAHFVYAVKTTKIYCRPSCAARLARRANVEFYSTPFAAAKAGFRACKRCKPDLEPQDDPQDVAVAKACEIIRTALSSSTHANGHIGLNELAERVHLTPSYLHKTFKAKTGMTPKAYAEKLRQQIITTELPTQSEFLVPHPTTYDVCSMFANDRTGPEFDFGTANLLDAESDSTGLTIGFSEGSPSINTPGTDWLWNETQEPSFKGYDFSDGEALAEIMLAQGQIDIGWDEHMYLPHEKGLRIMPDDQREPDLTTLENGFAAASF